MNPPKSHPAADQQLDYQVIVLELLAHDFRHLLGEFDIFYVIPNQPECTRSRLPLAMGVVDEQLFQVGFHLMEPAVGGGGLKIEHWELQIADFNCRWAEAELMLNDTIDVR